MRILLVEDEKQLSDALVEIMKKNNYTVDAKYDGEEGLYAAQTGIYDVIVLDVMMPKMDGFTVLKTLREDKILTPVIMLTAKSGLGAKTEGFELGADDYLTKPFLAKELMMRINAVSRRKGEIESTQMKFGDLILDTNTCVISSDNSTKTMQLSAKEFQVLEYLMKNTRNVISKEQFIDKIWGYESDTEYNNVEVYISFIRKKMNFVGCTTKIKAIRGMGYILEKAE